VLVFGFLSIALQRVRWLALVMILFILKMITHREACRSTGDAAYCRTR
jgi:hypothetical protein